MNCRGLRVFANRFIKKYSTIAEPPVNLCAVRARRNDLFTEEKARQQSLVTRMEKVKVEHKGHPEDCSLLMNKNLSTPFNVAMHVSELIMMRSVAALVNGEPWDMHRPLEEDCTLSFTHFKDEDPHIANMAFWRSCSFILGYILETAFKDNFHVDLCSFPGPNIKSGSFVYDADLKTNDWKPTQSELNCLSRIGQRLALEDLKFERLEVDASVAKNIFKHNKFKYEQIGGIAAQSKDGETVCVYRMGDHVDITRGPLISHTGQLGRFTTTAFHPIESPDYGALTRVQGLAMPSQIHVHYWTYEFLCERAQKLNPARIPRLHYDTETQDPEATEALGANGH